MATVEGKNGPEVQKFIDDAAANGYDRAALRRVAEEKLRSMLHHDQEKFDKSMMILWRYLEIPYAHSKKKK